jgi:hypothetical protein
MNKDPITVLLVEDNPGDARLCAARGASQDAAQRDKAAMNIGVPQ